MSCTPDHCASEQQSQQSSLETTATVEHQSIIQKMLNEGVKRGTVLSLEIPKGIQRFMRSIR